MKKKRILVVGGAGYIGSHVNKALNAKHYHTVVFDNLSRGCRSSVIEGEFVKGDMGNSQDLENVFSLGPFDAVFDFAALTDVGESIYHPDKYYKHNVVDTLNLIDAAVKNNVKFFVFSSTAAIFGSPESSKITEEHPKKPINPYGKTKLIVETILADYDVAFGLKSSCLRYFNAAGGDPQGAIKWQKRKENNLIPLLLRSLLDPESKGLTLFGTDYPTKDGSCIRDYIHVYDLADAHIKAMENLFITNTSSAYNLGNATGYSVSEVIKAVEAVTGKRLSITIGKRRAGDPPVLVADSAKAETILEWSQRYPKIEDMIAHAWEAMKAPVNLNSKN